MFVLRTYNAASYPVFAYFVWLWKKKQFYEGHKLEYERDKGKCRGFL